MKTTTPPISNEGGASLIEAIIAVGVLAVAIPLVFAAIAESGKSNRSSEAETRSTWMIPACMEEIQASRDGRPQYFTATLRHETFPPDGDVWALAFSAEGLPVGKLTKADYDKGSQAIDGMPIRYIASLSSTATGKKDEPTPILLARISLEFPAIAPSAKRQKLDFYTHIP
jgi:type II secretory pathway pseudopilin PulG